jgi:hypothetical protein
MLRQKALFDGSDLPEFRNEVFSDYDFIALSFSATFMMSYIHDFD